MLELEALNNYDSLKKLLGVLNIKLFEESIFRVQKEGKDYYSFPFYNATGEITEQLLFNKNYRATHKVKDDNSYWSKKNDLFNYSDIVLISDAPETLIQYYCKHYHHLKTKQISFVVPSKFDYKSFQKIKKDFPTQTIFTCFKKSLYRDILKIKSTFFLCDKECSITKEGTLFKVTSEDKEYCFQDFDYRNIRRTFRIKNLLKIEHKNV